MSEPADSGCPAYLIPVTNMSLEDLNQWNEEFWAERSLVDEALMSSPQNVDDALAIMAAKSNIGVPMRERSTFSAALDAASESQTKFGPRKWARVVLTVQGRRTITKSVLGGPSDSVSFWVEALLRTIAAPGTDDSVIVTQMRRITPLLVHYPAPIGSVANFRLCRHSTCVKGLKRFRAIARKMQKVINQDHASKSFMRARADLREVIAGLHQPTILMLYDFGLRGERGRLGDDKIVPRDADLKVAIAAAAGAMDWLAKVQKNDPSYISLGLETRRGRPTDEQARVVARVLYSVFAKLSGRRPALTVRPERDPVTVDGRYFRLVQAVFCLAGIKASPEAMARQAIKNMAAS